MADGMAWEDLTPELEGPGVGIRRMDAGGLATCLIRLDAVTFSIPRDATAAPCVAAASRR